MKKNHPLIDLKFSFTKWTKLHIHVQKCTLTAGSQTKEYDNILTQICHIPGTCTCNQSWRWS